MARLLFFTHFVYYFNYGSDNVVVKLNFVLMFDTRNIARLF